MMTSAIERIRKLLAHDTRDLIWLPYVVGIAPWMHRAAGPMHLLRRWQVRRRRQRDFDQRVAQLRARIGQGCLARGGNRVALAQLCPELDEICRAIRRPNEEITLASIDQDGLLLARFEQLWPAPRVVAADSFLPRSRFELVVGDRDGWVGVGTDVRGNRIAFVNELEAALGTAAAGCHVPAILGVDFDRPSITFSYLTVALGREALAQAGAPM